MGWAMILCDCNRLHPSPTESLEPLIAAFCEPHGLVLDPFCGSGSTLVAARRIGRNFMRFELDGGHYVTASRRIQPAPHALQEVA
jgi:site-specific DNA-methyltransferase (adenine-specific)